MAFFQGIVYPWLIELGYRSVRAPGEVQQVWPAVLEEALSTLAKLNFCVT